MSLTNRTTLVFRVFAVATALTALSIYASPLDSEDTDFLKKVAKGGNAEIELGHLANQKATNPAVKHFAQRMIQDHSKAGQKLATLASSKSVDLPNGKGLMNDALYLKLKALSGKDFDQAYMNAMVDDHKEDVSDFEKEASSAQDPAVKDFAAKTLPTLKSHLAMAEKIQAKIGQ